MNRIARFVIWPAALLASAAPLSALAAQQGPVVAVVAFNVHGTARDSRELAGIGKAVADLLATDLATSAAVQVLDRAGVQRAVGAQPPSRNGMIDRGAAVKAALQLGAAHVIYGGFSTDASGNVRLDARGVNTATGAVEFTERMQGSGDGVVTLVRQLASRLAAGMSLPARQGYSAGAAPALTLGALASYGGALDAADRGDRARAQELLRSVLAANPGFAPATAALTRLTPE